jgi:hypothetical protein
MTSPLCIHGLTIYLYKDISNSDYCAELLRGLRVRPILKTGAVEWEDIPPPIQGPDLSPNFYLSLKPLVG